jgi:O-succinylhomoserine sulfhydrylase
MTNDPAKTQEQEAWGLETRLVHGGSLRSQFAETSEALFLTQSYVYASAEQAEERFKSEAGFHLQPLRQPHGRHVRGAHAAAGRRRRRAGHRDGHGRRDGLAALLPQGRRSRGIGACAVRIVPVRGGGPLSPLRHRLDAGRRPRHQGVEARRCAPTTKAFFFETPANPTLDLVDIAAVCEIAHGAGALVVVDNVFATPVLQKPLQLGADVVVYSATKHVDGQGRCLGGIVLGSQAYVKDHLHNFLKHTGPSLSPFNAWVMLKGLETLPLRVRAQCETAAKVADHLAGQKGVTRVLFCGRSDHPQAAARQAADAGLGPGRRVRDRRRPRQPLSAS